MDRPRTDRDLRDLLTYLRDTFQDAASRIDAYLASQENPRDFSRPRPDANRNDFGGRPDANSRPEASARPAVDPRGERGRFEQPRSDAPRNDPFRNEAPRNDRPRGGQSQSAAPQQGPGQGVHFPLEKLREEVRWVSGEAGKLDPAVLRLHIEAITAETRSLQGHAEDPADLDIAAKIMRALTAIVSDHRPGHVYGLARHHQADWGDIARRARSEIRSHKSGNMTDVDTEELPEEG